MTRRWWKTNLLPLCLKKQRNHKIHTSALPDALKTKVDKETKLGQKLALTARRNWQAYLWKKAPYVPRQTAPPPKHGRNFQEKSKGSFFGGPVLLSDVILIHFCHYPSSFDSLTDLFLKHFQSFQIGKLPQVSCNKRKPSTYSISFLLLGKMWIKSSSFLAHLLQILY